MVGPARLIPAGRTASDDGGTVRTALVSPTTIMVHSALVVDAKTEEQQQHQDLHDAMLRLEASGEGRPLGQPDWRRRWSQIVSTPRQ